MMITTPCILAEYAGFTIDGTYQIARETQLDLIPEIHV